MRKKPFGNKLIDKYRPPRSHIAVGETCEKIGHEILEKPEGFDIVKESVEKFRGQPFDRLCRKNNGWYIVEIKGAMSGFGGGFSYTQKGRMRDVLRGIPELIPGFIQIDLKAARYKARYGEDVCKLIKEKPPKKQPIQPIIDWVKGVISQSE